MNIVLTGSSRGIGLYLYKQLKKKNKIFGISRTSGKSTDFVCDISDKFKVEKIFSKIKNIDVLINNASVTETRKIT